MKVNITLNHFEKIDGIRSAMLRGSDADEARYESRLFEALIETFGFDYANDIPDVGAYADALITDCLVGKVGLAEAF